MIGLILALIAGVAVTSALADARPQTLPARVERPPRPRQPEEDDFPALPEPPCEPGYTRLQLKPGLECFTPVLTAGDLYIVELTGTFSYVGSGTSRCHADACYDAGESQNYTKRHRFLFFNRLQVLSDPLDEDWELHRYTFPFTGEGRKLAILLPVPRKRGGSVNNGSRLTVVVRPPTDADGVALAKLERAQEEAKNLQEAMEVEAAMRFQLEADTQRAAEERRRKEEVDERDRLEQLRLAAEAKRRSDELRLFKEKRRERQEEEWRAAEEARQAAERATREVELSQKERARKLTARYSAHFMYEQQEFLEKHARTYCRELIRDRERIMREHEEFHADAGFIEYLRAAAAQTYLRATWKIRALAIAEQLDVEPPPAPQPPPPRRRLTQEDVRRAIVRPKQVKALDVMALAEAQAVDLATAKDSIGKMQLTPDERKRLTTQAIRDIEQIYRDREQEGSNGPHEEL